MQQEFAFTEEDRQFMMLAFDEARGALARGEVPIGCTIVRDGEVIAKGSNLTNDTRNGTRHAEMDAIDKVLEDVEEPDRSHIFERCRLFVTCEPCIMCSGHWACCGLPRESTPLGYKLKCRGGLMAEEAVALLKDFYATGNPKAPKPHRPLASGNKQDTTPLPLTTLPDS